MKREQLHFDVIIVGAGPAGLTASIRLLQLNPSLSICILEKGIEVGAHIISGAVLDPVSLNELLPDWYTLNPPAFTTVNHDQFSYLTSTRRIPLPVPRPMKNKNNIIISLSEWVRWLGKQAEKMGVNIFSGFSATRVLYENNAVIGVCTGDKGTTEPGVELFAKQTMFAEGCRGSLTEELIKTFHLREKCDPQTYALGLKEVWEIDAHDHHEGLVQHTIGWPLDHSTYGGSFLYHFGKNKISIGFVIGLDYTNPYLNPYEEFQTFKTHPSIYPMLSRGKRISYGARSLNEGGFQSIPKLSFPGGLLIGCAAGFLNVPKIKGIHAAMKSAMIAAESVHECLNQNTKTLSYEADFRKSWLYSELKKVRNIRPSMRFGLLKGLLYSAVDTYLFNGHAPWTFHHTEDHLKLAKASPALKKSYKKHDGCVTFDLMDSVYLTHTRHDEHQPCHLKIKDETVPISVNYALYDSPETRYCPAGVYEIVHTEHQPYLQINAANCIHCKACDIKDQNQNIQWSAPEGGSGPQYSSM